MGDDVWLRRQQALARFGEKALATGDIGALLHEACLLVVQGLDSPIAKVLKKLPDGELLLCAAVGIPRSVAVTGETRIQGSTKSAAGYAIDTGKPVMSHVPDEQRFEAGDIVRQMQVCYSLNVLVRCEDGAYGALEADRTEDRPYTEDDIDFLTTYANLLGAAIQRHRTGERINALLRSQTLLFRELQHRVKNDLQVVLAVIALQLNQPLGEEAKQQLESIRDRIDSLRVVHERLFAGSATGQIDLAEYLRALATGRFRMHGLDPAGAIQLEAPTAPLDTDHDVAIALGLIVNEFLTNSLKHAFPTGRGSVRIALTRHEGGSVRLHLADSGAPRTGAPKSGGGIGLKLIDLLVRQIDAEAAWSRDRGTRLELLFRPASAR